MVGWVPGIGEDCEGKNGLENEPPFLIHRQMQQEGKAGGGGLDLV